MKQFGFNLIELMISLVIGLVLMITVTTVFIDSKVSSERSVSVVNLQQQAQVALQILIGDIQNIGSWAAFSGESLSKMQLPVSMSITGCSIAAASGGVSTSLPHTTNWISDAASDTDGCLGVGYSLSENSDVLSLSRIEGDWQSNAHDAPSAGLDDDAYYVATAPQMASLFLGSNADQVKSMDNADVFPYLRHVYFTEESDDEAPRLKRFSLNKQVFENDVVVNNIERIRIEFGIDSDRDGSINQYLSSADITEAMWSNNQISAARVYVLARADHPDQTFQNTAKYNERYQPFMMDDNTNDHYRRFLLSTTVSIKNNKMVDL